MVLILIKQRLLLKPQDKPIWLETSNLNFTVDKGKYSLNKLP